MARTNIVIDDALMAEAMAASGARTKREAVERGLRALVERRRIEALRSLRGTLDWQGDLDSMRRDR
jgi:Arc/MetJ family transcription regulator